jgi:hypothetical protein
MDIDKLIELLHIEGDCTFIDCSLQIGEVCIPIPNFRVKEGKVMLMTSVESEAEKIIIEKEIKNG